MLRAYAASNLGVTLYPLEQDPSTAAWIDLLQPTADETALLRQLGVNVPTLQDMEEIEVSNRLYIEGDAIYMTVVIPVATATRLVATPVTFIMTPERLVTVRYLSPRPFETFPNRTEGCFLGKNSPARIMLGLLEEIIGRLADVLEGAGGVLDDSAAEVLGGHARTELLAETLRTVGTNAERTSRVRLCLLTLERMLLFYLSQHPEGTLLEPGIDTLRHDIRALEVHCDFLSARISLVVDATMGMINLQQNRTSKTLSVVAALFLPPTLIASIYGMNFELMPELASPWGYTGALGAMFISSLATYMLFRWRSWL